MKRQNVKFPWNLYWENKTYKLKRSITVKLQHIYPAKRSAEFQGKISGFPCGKARKKPGKARSDLSLQTFQKFLESPESQGKLFHSFWALMCKKGTELLTRMPDIKHSWLPLDSAVSWKDWAEEPRNAKGKFSKMYAYGVNTKQVPGHIGRGQVLSPLQQNYSCFP